MAALADLIRRRKEELGLSFRQLGQRALDAGAPVVPNWSHLTNQQLKLFPEPDTVHMLAAVLEVDRDEIVDAILDDIGLSRNRVVQPGGRWIVISAENLSAEDEAVIRKESPKPPLTWTISASPDERIHLGHYRPLATRELVHFRQANQVYVNRARSGISQ